MIWRFFDAASLPDTYFIQEKNQMFLSLKEQERLSAEETSEVVLELKAQLAREQSRLASVSLGQRETEVGSIFMPSKLISLMSKPGKGDH